MVIRDIRSRIRMNPICFHPKGWKLEGNKNTVIRDIRIRIRANPIRFHSYVDGGEEMEKEEENRKKVSGDRGRRNKSPKLQICLGHCL